MQKDWPLYNCRLIGSILIMFIVLKCLLPVHKITNTRTPIHKLDPSTQKRAQERSFLLLPY